MFLNHIQIKSARCALNLGVRDLGTLIHTSRTTISKLEHNIIMISNMRLANRRNLIFCEFFKKNQIIFPNSSSISLVCINTRNSTNPLSVEVMTRFQLRVSRIILKKTQADLAKLVHVPPSVIKKAESFDNQFLLKANNLSIVSDLLNLLKQEGLEFPTPYSVIFKNFS